MKEINNAINDGGYAFPSTPYVGDHLRGMSLRDWFAGMAMQGALSNSNQSFDWEGAAFDAYKQADAMIEARSRKDETK